MSSTVPPMMPTRQNTEVPADWRPAAAPTRQATEVDHSAFPTDPPHLQRETAADVGGTFDAPDEAESAPEPPAKKRCTALRIEIPYTAAEDPEEHSKQIKHFLACLARAAVETIQETEAEPEAEPKTGNLTAAGNFFPDTKTGKVHVQDKTA